MPYGSSNLPWAKCPGGAIVLTQDEKTQQMIVRGKPLDDIIFEQDYRRKPEDMAENARALEIFDRAFNGSFFKDYTAAMDAIPKVIVPEDKENYEYLLSRCDAVAKRRRWKVKGVVDYHRWYSYIDLTMPLPEFDDADSLMLLREIAERATIVTFEQRENNSIGLHIMINYFQELMNEEHRSYLEFDAISNDEKLAEMVGIQPLSPEMEEKAQRLNAILDRFDAETEYDRTMIFRALWEHMPKEKDQTFDRMIELAEKLLEATLNEQSGADQEEQ